MNGKDAGAAPPHNAASGFTLLELMTCLAVAAVLLAIAVPGFSNVLLNAQRAAVVNDMVAALTFARNHAISTRKPVTICRSTDTSTCAERGNWQSGWIVFADLDVDGFRDPEEEILRQHEAINGSVSLNGNTNIGQRITFRNFGGTANNGRIVYCDRRGWSEEARIVIVSTTGRARIVTRSQDPNTPLTGCSP